MDIKFVGTGWYRDIDCGNSAAIVTINQKKVLIDCGSDTYEKLVRKWVVDQIDYVLLTHLHWDHIGSLFTLIRYTVSQWKKIKILYPDSDFKALIMILFELWFDNIDDVVCFSPLDTVTGIHAVTTTWYHNVSPKIMTYWYRFQEWDNIIYYSWDIGNMSISKQYIDSLPQNKNITIFHDVALGNWWWVHTTYQDIMESLSSYSVYGYHCNHTQKPDDCRVELVAEYPEFLL